MNLLRNLAKALTTTRSTPDQLPPAAQTWLRGADGGENTSKLVAPYSQSAWIYVAISVLGETVAHIPFRLSRGKGRNKTMVESGPVYDLFQRPHPSMTRALFWQTIVSWESLRGEFFIAPLDRSGQPIAVGPRQSIKPAHLLPLNPDWFAHIVDGHDLVGWKYCGLTQTSPLPPQVLLPEEVIHSRNFNPYYFWRGLSPLSVAMLPAAGDYAAEQFMKGLMINNGDSGLIVTTEEMIDETQREQFLAAINDRKRRAGTADRPLFLWGKAKVEKASISSADLQFLENRKLNRQEIGAIFKVPESMMGFAGQKSMLSGGSAIEQDRLNFIESTISGLCHRIETAMEPLIKSFDHTLDGWFDLESLPIMQAARRERMLTAQKAFAMGVPFNEINHVYDLGFESLPWGDKGYLQRELHEIGTMPPEKSKGEPHAMACAGPSIGRMLQLLDSAEDGASTHESDISDRIKTKAGKLRRFFFEQRGRVLQRLEHWNQEKASASELFDLSRENELLLERMQPLLIDDLQAGAAESGVKLEVLPETAESYCTGRAGHWKLINQTTYDAVEQILTPIATKNELAERLKGIFNKTTSQCEEIATRETTSAWNAGRGCITGGL